MYLRYVKTQKTYLQLHQWLFFPLGLEILRSSQGSQFENKAFPKIAIALKVLSMHIPDKKNIFNSFSKIFSIFNPQNTWILPFSIMPVWEKLKITVWEWKAFKSKFCNKNFRQVPVNSRKYSHMHHQMLFFCKATK